MSKVRNPAGGRRRRGRPPLWIDRPLPPLSPYQWGRLAEFGLIFDLLTTVEANWRDEARDEDDVRLDFPMLLAATRWTCRLRLPAALVEDFMLGPPLLSRRRPT